MSIMLMHAGATGHLHTEDFLTVAIFGALGVLSVAFNVWQARKAADKREQTIPYEVQ